MDQTDYRYVAGLFDGEGSVSIATSKRPSGRPYFYMRVRINMANRNIIEQLHKAYGGCVVKTRPKGGVGHPIYNWQLSGRGAKSFLLGIREHSICKREVIDIGLEFISTLGVDAYSQGGVSDKINRRRSMLRELLMALNKRD